MQIYEHSASNKDFFLESGFFTQIPTIQHTKGYQCGGAMPRGRWAWDGERDTFGIPPGIQLFLRQTLDVVVQPCIYKKISFRS